MNQVATTAPPALRTAGVAASTRFGPALLLLVLWALHHPYRGIKHDGRLYAIEALHRLNPEFLSQDLYFAFGSQGDYTLFPALYAAAIHVVGLNAASMVLVVLANALWLWAAFTLLRRFADRLPLWLMLALVTTLPATYGGGGVFAYGEGFATPRTYAEALILFSLAALSDRRIGRALALALAAAVLHPLMALPGLAILLVDRVVCNPRWLLLPLVAGAAVIGLAWAGVQPFSPLFQTMDREWFDVVAVRNAYVFPSAWSPQDLSVMMFDGAIIVTAAAASAGRGRRLLLAVCAVGIGGVTLSWLGGDLLRNVLIIQLQLWRASWLLHVLAYPALVIVLLALSRHSANVRPIAALIAAAWFLLPFPILNPLGVIAAVLATADLSGRLPSLSLHARRVVYVTAGFAALVWILLHVLKLDALWRELPSHGGWPGLLLAVPFIVQCMTLTLVAVWLAGRVPVPGQRAVQLVALAAAIAAGPLWDRRTPWDRLLGASPSELAHFANLIPADAQIYWQGDVRVPWLVLRRASYVSALHGASAPLSRATAIEYRDRIRQILPLVEHEKASEGGEGARSSHAGAAVLERVCAGAPELDFAVLAAPSGENALAVWRASAHPPITYVIPGSYLRSKPRTSYFLYACDDYRG